MKSINLSNKKNEFNGKYYISDNQNTNAFILVLGNEEEFTKAAAKYLKEYKVNVLGIYPYENEKKCYKYSEFVIEKIEKAISYLKDNGITNIGIVGGSTYTSISLLASSLYEDITLSINFTPIDYISEGLIQPKHGKIKEGPSGKSLITKEGVELPYHKFNLDLDSYWKEVKSLEKQYNEPHMIDIYNKMEEVEEIKEEEFIPIENIKGNIVFIASKDDSMWNSVNYIERMNSRLKKADFKYEVTSLIYDYGTHFIFPEKMFKKLSSLGGTFITHNFISSKKNKQECKATYQLIDMELEKIIKNWVK